MKTLRLLLLLPMAALCRAADPTPPAWSRPGSPTGYQPVAVGADGTIYAPSADGTHTVVALDPQGRLLWGHLDPTTSFLPPAVAENGDLCLVTTDRRLVVLDRNGRPRWEHYLPARSFHVPALGADGTVFVGDAFGNFHAIRADGTPAWTHSNPAGFTSGSPVVLQDGSVVAVDADGAVLRLASDGRLLWRSARPGAIGASPAVGPDGRILVLQSSGILRCLSEDGTDVWGYDSGERSMMGSPVVDGEGRTYFGGAGGLHAVGPDGRRLWLRPLPGGVGATPLVAEDGTLVVPSYDYRLNFLRSDGTVRESIPTEGRLLSAPTLLPSGLLVLDVGGWNLTAFQTALRPAAAGWPRAKGNPRLTGRAPGRPAVRLVSPDGSGIHRTDEGVPFVAEATSPNGAVARVELLSGTNVVATAVGPSFAGRWSSPPPGTSAVRARAVDVLGASTVTPEVVVRVADPVGPPILLRGLSATTNAAGPAFSATVETLSLTPVVYEWFIDGRPAPGFDGPTFSVSGTSPNNSGAYTVVARNAFGAVTSAPADMTFLLEPEVFWERPLFLSEIRPSIGPDGRIYAQNGDGLHVMDRAGVVQWTVRGWMAEGVPVGEDGSVLVNQEGGRLTLLDRAGATLWSVPSTNRVLGAARDRQGGFYTVTSAIAPEARLERRSPEGLLLWGRALRTQVHMTPMIATNGHVVVGTADGRILAFTPDGDTAWERPAGGLPVRGGAIAGDGTLVFAAGSLLVTFRPDGTAGWRQDLGGAAGRPVVAPDGAVFIGQSERAEFSPFGTGRVNVFERDGRLRWSRQVPYPVHHAGALAADGTFFVGSGSRLLAWNPNGTLRFLHETADAPLSSPVIGFDGTVYVVVPRGALLAVRGTLASPANGWPCAGRDVRCRSDASGAPDPDTFFFPTASNDFDGPVDHILPLSGERFLVAGRFQVAGGRPASRVAGWDGTNWHRLGNGLAGQVRKLVLWRTNVMALVSPDPAGIVAPSPWRWNGSQWIRMDAGAVDGFSDLVSLGDELLGITFFPSAENGGLLRKHLCRWNGSAWVPRDGPIPFQDLSLFPSGTVLRGIAANRIHELRDGRWVQMGAAFDEQPWLLHETPAGLLATGPFTLGGRGLGRIARWNGTNWIAVGGGLGAHARFYSWAGQVASDGTNLFVAGYFTIPGNTDTATLARWNGTNWTALLGLAPTEQPENSGLSTVVHHGGRLLVGGEFLRLGERRDLRRFAIHDGVWRSLGNPVLTIDPQLGFHLFNVLGRPYVLESSEDLATWRVRFRYDRPGPPVEVPATPEDQGERRFYRITVP